MSGSNGNVLNPANDGAILNSDTGSSGGGGLVPAPILPLNVINLPPDGSFAGPQGFSNVIAISQNFNGSPGAGAAFVPTPAVVSCESNTLESPDVVLRQPFADPASGSIALGGFAILANPNDADLTDLVLSNISGTIPALNTFVARAVMVRNPLQSPIASAFAGWIVITNQTLS